MEHAALAPFGWDNFWVIIGSSAGALTGLQFVVIALGAELRPIRGPEVGAWATPTIVHFCAVLVAAAILSAPWPTITSAGIALSLLGAAGIAYTAIVAWRATRPSSYAPVLEDWLWHAVFPLVAYTVLWLVPLLLEEEPRGWLFAIAAAALVLLFVGIHNAWDAVTYMAMERSRKLKEPPDGG